jgi:hypothetical protein
MHGAVRRAWSTFAVAALFGASLTVAGCGSRSKTRIPIPELVRQLQQRNPSFKRPGRSLKCRYDSPTGPDDAICALLANGRRLAEFTVKIKDGKVVEVIGVPT